jgi:hypothetical protein
MNFRSKLAAAAASTVAAGSAFATAPTTVAGLADAVDFTNVGTGILAVSGAILSIYVLWKGAKMIIRAVKGA